MSPTCHCGAPIAKHDTRYAEGAACIEALKAHRVMRPCEWPGCGKRTRKINHGFTLCRAHRKSEWDAFMGITHLEGPATLNRPLPTIAEMYEFSQTGKLPASRLVPVTFKTAKVQCGECGGPLIIVNDPDWSPDLPNAMSCRYTEPGNAGSAVPWGIGICRRCSFKSAEVSHV